MCSSSLPPQVHAPSPSFPSSTSIILPSQATAHTLHLPPKSMVHKLTSQVAFTQSSSPHTSSSLSFTPPPKSPFVPPLYLPSYSPRMN